MRQLLVSGRLALRTGHRRRHLTVSKGTCVQAAAKAEGQARAAAAAEARQVREKARRVGQMRRAPKDVVMSEAQRRMVQSILREQGHDIASTAPASAAFETSEGRSQQASP